MTELSDRIADLTPEQRSELSTRLLQQTRADDRISPRAEALERRPVSFAQQRLWFLQQLEPEDTSYTMPLALRLRGRLDAAALELSLEEIVRRHEALRTTFAVDDGSPVQVIAQSIEMALPIEEVPGTLDDERQARALELAREEKQRPFDLERGPLFRVRLLRLSDEEHVLVVGMHHVVGDGWSIDVLRRELDALYEAFSAGRPSPLPALPIQYADYAAWQRGWLTGEVLERQLAYWKGQLAGVPKLDLPTDRPRPAVQTHRGSRAELTLPQSLTDALKQLARREGATLFMVLLGALQVLLARHSGQEDIAVGSPIAGRNRSETEGLIGFFVNTLVLRSDLSGDPSFRELLGRVREVCLGAYEHQEMPFEKLVEELRPERDLSRTPLCQVFLNMVNLPSRATELGNLAVESISFPDAEAKFDLNLYAEERAGEIALSARYNVDLFDRETIEQMLGHFRVLLEGIAVDPERRLSALPLLSAEERSRLRGGVPGRRAGVRPSGSFVAWTEEDIEQSIAARFEQQVRTHPRNVAVKTRDHELTYAELSADADRVAHALAGRYRGEGPARIALLLGHGAPMLAGLLGVLKAGRAYVPLDLSDPEERLAYMLDDVEAGAVLTDDANLALATTLTEGKLELINVDEPSLAEGAAPGAGAAADLPAAEALGFASPESVAYVLYTSGSTGRPKGVVQSHRNVLHFIRAYTNELRIGSGDRLTLLSSYAFDAAVMDIFGALLNGATLCPINLRGEGLNALGERLAEERVTVYHSTPTVYRHFVEALGARHASNRGSAPNGSNGDARATLPDLRLVALGGEAVNSEDVERCRTHLPRECTLVNLLGPSEASVALMRVVDRQAPLVRHAVPAGHPVEGTEVLLLDGHGREAEVYGEIAIRSPHVALGYWRRPELTRKAFPPDPSGGGRRVYLTGDLGRLLPDGSIEWRGRKDHQVKLRGHRVEPGEIEACLCAHPGLAGAAVVAREEPRGDCRLVAYLVPVAAEAPALADLRVHLRRALPEHMVPAAFVVLDSLPLTPNGKLDRRALPAPPEPRPDAGAEGDGPEGPLEAALCAIWENVLETEQVGVDDDFFDLGGHSLLSLSLFAEIERILGVRLPLAAIFEAPTIRRLAPIVDEGGSRRLWRSLVALETGGSKTPFFCVPGGDGVVVGFSELARRIGRTRPFYALQPRGLDGETPLHTRVEDMAEHYVAELRMVQPRGPYLLGGRCFGGKVAYEMAQQLRASGEEVALLAVLDSGSPRLAEQSEGFAYQPEGQASTRHARLRAIEPTSRAAASSVSSRVSATRRLWRTLRRGPAKLPRKVRRAVRRQRRLVRRRRKLLLSAVKRQRTALRRALRRARKSLQRVGLWPGMRGKLARRGVRMLKLRWNARLGHPHALRIIQVRAASVAAGTRYRTRAYPGAITLIRSEGNAALEHKRFHLDWSELAQDGLEVVVMPGEHWSILEEPHVAVLAEWLETRLEAAERMGEH